MVNLSHRKIAWWVDCREWQHCHEMTLTFLRSIHRIQELHRHRWLQCCTRCSNLQCYTCNNNNQFVTRQMPVSQILRCNISFLSTSYMHVRHRRTVTTGLYTGPVAFTEPQRRWPQQWSYIDDIGCGTSVKFLINNYNKWLLSLVS